LGKKFFNDWSGLLFLAIRIKKGYFEGIDHGKHFASGIGSE
jgi:hypothetical protein